MFGNAVGYAYADSIIDFEFEYILHHSFMILLIECLLHGIKYEYFFLTGYYLELGNFFTHFISLLTFRKGAFYHKSHTISFWISRIIGISYGGYGIYDLFFVERVYTFYSFLMFVLYILMSFLNIFWMMRMIRNRKEVGN